MFWLSAITFKCHFYGSKTCMYRSLLIPSLKQSCIYTIVSSFVRLSASFYNDNNWYFDLGQTDAECLLDGIGGYTTYYCDTDSLKHLLVFIKVVKLEESVFSVRTFLFDSDEDNRDLTTGGGFSIRSVHYVYIVISELYLWTILTTNTEFWIGSDVETTNQEIPVRFLDCQTISRKKWAMHAGWS